MIAQQLPRSSLDATDICVLKPRTATTTAPMMATMLNILSTEFDPPGVVPTGNHPHKRATDIHTAKKAQVH